MDAGSGRWLGQSGGGHQPDFTLLHEYPDGRLPVFHFDFHRAGQAAEILAIGWDDYLEREGVVVAEWADRFPELFPPGTRWLRLRHDGAIRWLAEETSSGG